MTTRIDSCPETSPHERSAFDGSAIVDRVHRGVIYGRKGSVGEASTEIEFFANGLPLGMVEIGADSEPGATFLLRIPQHLLLEAPVTIRARDAAGEVVPACEVMLGDPVAVDAALSAAHGTVAFEDGMLRGTLHDVNPDALPLVVTVSAGGRLVASTEVRRPLHRPSTGGALLGALPFLIALPVDTFGQSSTTLCVGLSGNTVEFDGSPIVISVSHGKSIEARLAHLETAAVEIKESVETLRSDVLSDIARQFYSLILPRVDAIVETQRTSLERQMSRLWLELTGKDQPALPQPPLPLTASIDLSGDFVGYGWISPFGEIGGAKWLRDRAFLVAQVNPEEDVLLTVMGDDMISTSALDALRITVNGSPIPVWATQRGKTSNVWEAYGVIGRSNLSNDGTVNIELECPVYGLRRFERGDILASLSVTGARLESGRNIEGTGPGMLTDQNCLVGFHSREQTEDGLPFRWLSQRGLLVIRQPGGAEAARVRVGGPFILNPKIAESFQIRLLGTDGARTMPVDYHNGWSASHKLAAQHASTPTLHLLAFSAEAERPSAQDSRLLSVALAHIDVETCD